MDFGAVLRQTPIAGFRQKAKMTIADFCLEELTLLNQIG